MRKLLVYPAILMTALLTACSGGGTTSQGSGGSGLVARNRAPVAVAGPDQTVQVGGTALLDGSKSSDPDGDSLTYQWTISTKPAGSNASLSDAASAQTSLSPDVKGTYRIQLRVTDSGGLSATDQIIITVPNRAPVADAGGSQAITVGSRATLDGSRSWDPDGDQLTYEWTLVSKPFGSDFWLYNATSAQVFFNPDVKGTYQIQLKVTDSEGLSSIDEITIVGYHTPVLRMQGPAIAARGSAATYDASESLYIEDARLVWELIARPEGSTAELTVPEGVTTSFTPDIPGSYLLRLTTYPDYGEPVVSELSVIGATPLSGIYSSDFTMVLSESPYMLAGWVQVASSSRFAAEPGVELYGQGYQLQVWGLLDFSGTEDARILLNNVRIKSDRESFMNLRFVDFDGGAFLNDAGLTGSFWLQDSRLIGLPAIRILSPPSDVLMARNSFCLYGGINVSVIAILNPITIYVQNNSFSYCGGWGAYAVAAESTTNAEIIVRGNTFLDTDHVALSTGTGNIDARENYWSTTSPAVIEQMILDRNDDLNRTYTIPYEPFLTEPDPNTPVVEFW
ncbi:MAG: hypothetical protein GXX84_14820 [Acidobacteria bacterium]|nr:hypothetical protein [Acidobacteriota bacterium]